MDITYAEAKELKAGSMTAADILRGAGRGEASRSEIESASRAYVVAARVSHDLDPEQQKCHAQPLNDRVLLRRVNQDSSKAVKIADAFQPKSNRGEVIAVGPEAKGMLSPGDQVLFSHYSAQDIEVEGEELVIISVHDIWLRL